MPTGPASALFLGATQRFWDQVASGLSLPVQWDNRSVLQTGASDNAPVPDPDPSDPTGSRWAQVWLEPSLQTVSIGVGARTMRQHGDLIVRTLVPRGVGESALLDVFEATVTAFRWVTDGSIHYSVPDAIEHQLEESWFAGQVRVPARWIGPDPDPATPYGTITVAASTTAALAEMRERFGREIEDALGITTLYENDPRTPPDDELWCMLTIQRGAGMPSVHGDTPRTRTLGRITCSVFAPADQGTGAAWGVIDTVAARFRATRDGGVAFFAPSIVRVGRRSGPFWQANVHMPFVFEE